MTSLLTGSGFPGVDSIFINNDFMPGQWILRPCYRVFGWQIQAGFGLAGATVFPKSDELLVAPFEIRIWTEDDYGVFRLKRASYLKKPVFTQQNSLATFALSISHPELADLGCDAFVVLKVPVMTNNGKGMWSGTVEFLQYRPPVPVLSKPSAAIPPAANPKPTAEDQFAKDVADRQAQLAAARGP